MLPNAQSGENPVSCTLMFNLSIHSIRSHCWTPYWVVGTLLNIGSVKLKDPVRPKEQKNKWVNILTGANIKVSNIMEAVRSDCYIFLEDGTCDLGLLGRQFTKGVQIKGIIHKKAWGRWHGQGKLWDAWIIGQVNNRNSVSPLDIALDSISSLLSLLGPWPSS